MVWWHGLLLDLLPGKFENDMSHTKRQFAAYVTLLQGGGGGAGISGSCGGGGGGDCSTGTVVVVVVVVVHLRISILEYLNCSSKACRGVTQPG